MIQIARAMRSSGIATTAAFFMQAALGAKAIFP